MLRARITALAASCVASGFLACLLPSAALAEWRALFDARTADAQSGLEGWRRIGVGGTFEVRPARDDQPAEIVGTYVAGTPNVFLATRQAYGDFVLDFEFFADDGINSGVQFRSMSRPDYQNGRVHGYQYEIDPTARAWTAGIFDEARRGWLYQPSLNPKAQTLLRHRDWNRARIECAGNSIRTWLNGEPVAHLIDAATAEGFIALQVHGIPSGSELAGRTVRWRNIRIWTGAVQPTRADDVRIVNTIPNHLSDAEAMQGWSLLFDGRTTDGWRGAHRESFPEGGWTVRDGELVVEASGGGESRNGGDIVTMDEYGAFELQLEFLPAEGANSGIKYFVTEGYLSAGQQASAIGPEYQILDDERHPDGKLGVVGNRTMASLYDLIPSDRVVGGREVPRRVGDWNQALLVARADGTVQHWLNQYRVVEYQRGSNIYAALVARSKYKDWDGFGLAETGHLLLQDHGDLVRFRSIKVRRLDESR